MAQSSYKHLEIPTDFAKYVTNKKESAKSYYRYLLARCEKMFQYRGLPDTIPAEILDRYLMNNGICCITEYSGELYCFYGNVGGEQDVYYRPSKFIVANPHMPDGSTFTANVQVFGQPRDGEKTQPGVLMRNDTEWIGLSPLLSRYSFLMAENTLTLRTADVLLRIVALLTAPTDKERLAAIDYINSIENGQLSVIGESPFFDGVKMQSPPSNNGSYLTQFIEFQQYLKGSFFNEIGLSANYNMKREAIGKGESTLDQDALLPLCENMLLCRRQDLALVNQAFGTDIQVDFSSAWLQNEIEALKILGQNAGGNTGFRGEDVELGGPEETNGEGATDEENKGEDVRDNGETGAEDRKDEDKEVSADKGSGDNAADRGVITEGNEVDREAGESEESGEGDEEGGSRINDLTADNEMTVIHDALVDQVENGGIQAPVEEVSEDDTNDEKASEDEGDSSGNE